MISLDALTVIGSDENPLPPLTRNFEPGYLLLTSEEENVFSILTFDFLDIKSGAFSIDEALVTPTNKDLQFADIAISVKSVCSLRAIFALKGNHKEISAAFNSIMAAIRGVKTMPVENPEQKAAKLGALIAALEPFKPAYITLDYAEAVNTMNREIIERAFGAISYPVIAHPAPIKKKAEVKAAAPKSGSIMAENPSLSGLKVFYKTEVFSFLIILFASLLSAFAFCLAPNIFFHSETGFGVALVVCASITLILYFVVLVTMNSSLSTLKGDRMSVLIAVGSEAFISIVAGALSILIILLLKKVNVSFLSDGVSQLSYTILGFLILIFGLCPFISVSLINWHPLSKKTKI